MNEAETCRTLVRPKLEEAGWDGNKHFYSEQISFTDGRIIVPAGKPRRLKKKFSDFLLCYTRDITLAVVEAKSSKRPAGDGLQQAKDYATILGLKFAYATNGNTIIEYDFFTGLEQDVERFPTPDDLWHRYRSATQKFADPEFDGEPALVSEEEIDEYGETIKGSEHVEEEQDDPSNEEETSAPDFDDENPEPRKFYVHGGPGGIDTEVTMDLDFGGSKLRTVQITQYVADTVRTLYTNPDDLRTLWSDFKQRSSVVGAFEERGIDFQELAAQAGHPDADPYDLLCHLAFNAPLLTRKQRAEKLRKEKQDFFDQFGPKAKAILEELLNKYAEHRASQFSVPDVLEVPPISTHGNVVEIAKKYGGVDRLHAAVNQLQLLIYCSV